jgi:hypothetical protein
LEGRALDLWDMILISWRKGNYLGKGKEGIICVRRESLSSSNI